LIRILGSKEASYVNVGLLESLGLEFLPDHVALGGVGIKANPSLELVIVRHDMCCCSVDFGWNKLCRGNVKSLTALADV
jgi:hypothetical protein